jgi:hypothetical protein
VVSLAFREILSAEYGCVLIFMENRSSMLYSGVIKFLNFSYVLNQNRKGFYLLIASYMCSYYISPGLQISPSQSKWWCFEKKIKSQIRFWLDQLVLGLYF